MAAQTQPVRRGGLLGLRGTAAREATLGLSIVGVIYLFFLLFVFVPMLIAIYVSLTKWDALSAITSAKFVGLQNYIDLLYDTRFHASLVHIAEWTIKTYVGQMGLGLLLALLVIRLTHLQSLARFIIFTPYVLPMVATAILFTIMMNPVFGSFNEALRAVGIPASQFLADPGSAMNSIVLMVTWKYVGYYMVLFLTALMAVPQEYYDAAHIDGAGPLQSFRSITWPLIRPAFFFISVTNIIGNMQVFTPVLIMTGGGPMRSTEVVVMYMYNTAFTNFRYSVGNAMAIVLFFILLVLTLFQMRVLRTED
jgi:multiple sugar transport system permease protein